LHTLCVQVGDGDVDVVAHQEQLDGIMAAVEDRAADPDWELIGGREPAVVQVVDYDERWPVTFRARAARIEDVLEGRACGIEHIGSTSVPGLAAKPIVDALLTVPDIEDEAAYQPALETIGLVLRVRERAHRMFRTPQRDFHLHVYEPNRSEVRDYLDLRDWLRVSEADRQLYVQTKRHLAQQPWGDMNDYAVAKTEVVQEILRHAREWRQRGADEAGQA
jgi:GrpB-like predicted nucleotidyltransferase (UPF0157 family)